MNSSSKTPTFASSSSAMSGAKPEQLEHETSGQEAQQRRLPKALGEEAEQERNAAPQELRRSPSVQRLYHVVRPAAGEARDLR